MLRNERFEYPITDRRMYASKIAKFTHTFEPWFFKLISTFNSLQKQRVSFTTYYFKIILLGKFTYPFSPSNAISSNSSNFCFLTFIHRKTEFDYSFLRSNVISFIYDLLYFSRSFSFFFIHRIWELFQQDNSRIHSRIYRVKWIYQQSRASLRNRPFYSATARRFLIGHVEIIVLSYRLSEWRG